MKKWLGTIPTGQYHKQSNKHKRDPSSKWELGLGIGWLHKL